jgi:Gamma-glutamyl cyclotransferase, AIG2-like
MESAMKPRRVRVFFYGLFMDADLLRALGIRPTCVRAAQVSGYALRIGQRATLVPDETSTVHGVVMNLTDAELGRLYAGPGLEAYVPKAILISGQNGKELPAVCFNLAVTPAPFEANPEYAAKLRALAERLGFPESYVNSIH